MSICAAEPSARPPGGASIRRLAPASAGVGIAPAPSATGLAIAALCASLCAISPLAEAAAPPPRQGARVVEHRVRAGDTLAALALRFYGDTERADLLARVNGIADIRNLRVGQRLRVPLSISYRVRPGDTASEIAERHLGGASRHGVLLEINRLPARAALAVGDEIEIPALIEHRLAGGETLGEIAKRYCGDAGRAGWIADLNGIERPDSVGRGTRLQVPVVGALPARRGSASAPAKTAEARAPEPKPAAKPAPKPAKEKPAETRAVEKKPAETRAPSAQDPAVKRAVQLYTRGEYRRAGDLLQAALDSGALEGAEKTRALRHRAYCAVATGDRAAARRAFLALRRHDPGWKPDPVEDSPKIRQAFSEAVFASSLSPSGS